jgi:hypothetical protein
MSKAEPSRKLPKGEHELTQFLRLSSTELLAEHCRITGRSKEDHGTAGDETEELWKEILQAWLPDYYPIVTKGRIINEHGDCSPQMDVLVLNPAYPRRIRNKKLYLAGGVLAAFECKTTLRSTDLEKFYKSCRRIKTLYAVSQGTIFKELFAPIYCGLLALSSGPLKVLTSKCEQM